ncbi:leucyl-tRNA synthetase [Pricia antarctica]|uniref:Leucine--tRNA ligase n=1 Tax=Pricia antarctica TaxID=641691 RepID=A0A1G6Y305_9FLAO|nr:class I tRNA ligase family protein [Pricia antarctica]SDD84730.1 leucyl-tRNA synthetase [Pricia antarctica]
MHYDFGKIEKKWQNIWAKRGTFKAENNSERKKFYVLDMFPYPSGAGLHVGHPLGYIASDIYARYKRHKGYNVLHPMGYDSFGLPAEQYAIQTGQHPAITTEENIKTYRRQLDQLGFSFDWSREIRTSDPKYYKWTQWVFIQLFNSWYNSDSDKAEPIEDLVSIFERDGNTNVNAVCDDDIPNFSADEWNASSSNKKQETLLKYRLTYLADADVNWCPALGTVLANDEIVNGVSERGGHPVVRKKMRQWMMRITAYTQRLLDGLDKIDWPQPLKDSQANWIGRSEGATVKFRVRSSENGVVSDNIDDDEITKDAETIKDAETAAHNPALFIDVFTTRPDTIFGVSFMTLAPEHELVSKITTSDQKAAVEAYVEATAKRSERDRMADVKTITGAFTGAYAEHPFTKEPIPIWIGDYVLAGYGTGAVMSVPCGDQRDYDFAKHFGINIPNIFEGIDISEEAFADKEKTIITNSDFLNGLPYKKAVKKSIAELETLGQGEGKINYRLRDAVFSRQRYWGEPFPVYYVDGMPQMIADEHLPIMLPEVEKYLPTETGEPPLGNATDWAWDTNTNQVVSNENVAPSARLQVSERANSNFTPSSSAERSGSTDKGQSNNNFAPSAVEEQSNDNGVYPLELNTMPGWAGSSQYFNRYMDPHNDDEIFSQEAIDYWQDVDLYIGGSEHATGHLLYSRFWQKFMFDRGLVPVDEYAKKLINQGMITGTSAFVHRWDYTIGENKKAEKKNVFISQKFVKKMLSKSLFLEDVLENYEILRKSIFDFHEKDKNEMGFIKVTDSPSSISKIHSDVSLVNSSDELDIQAFIKWQPDSENSMFILENGEIYDVKTSPEGSSGGAFIVNREVEKMSKSKYNVVNPENIVKEYGADSLRMYEMFLGPMEQSKPWNTAGITGVHGFLKKLWKLYHSGPNGEFTVADLERPAISQTTGTEASGGGDSFAKTSDNQPQSKDEGLREADKPAPESLKTLHKTIKKVEDDIQNFSFNTSVSTFMICVNELTSQKCTSREILEPLAILMSPYAPHIAEELWEKLGHTESIATASFPKFEEKYIVESSKEYPISFNGKTRFTMELSLDLDRKQIEEVVMAHKKTQQQLDGRTPKKVIVVPGKIVNIVG